MSDQPRLNAKPRQQQPDAADREPDIVLTVLASVKLRVQLTPDQEADIVREIRSAYGGLRVRIPKRGKHPTPEQRRKAFEAGLTSASNEEIQESHGISRATLYRYMSKPPG